MLNSENPHLLVYFKIYCLLCEHLLKIDSFEAQIKETLN